MDSILTKICSISNHPISILDKRFRVTYVQGLAASLYILSENSRITKLFFDVWAHDIVQDNIKTDDIWLSDIPAIKDALRIKRKGFRFFSMKYCFYFDCYYLLSISITTSNLHEKIFDFLKKNTGNILTTRALKYINQYFSSNNDLAVAPKSKIAESLRAHKDINDKHINETPVRVLVVANVSAGKSTLINALVGYRLNHMKTTACTDRIIELMPKPFKDGITYRDSSGCYSYSDDVNMVSSNDIESAGVYFKSSLKNTVLLDTPGINNSEELMHKTITESAIKQGNYDGVIYISNCKYFGTNDEHAILLKLKQKVHVPIIFVLNQLDKFRQQEDSIAEMLLEYKSDLVAMGFKNPAVVPVSAKAALLFRLSEEELDEDDIYEKEKLIIKFQNDYYNLPQYTTASGSDDLLSRTGIVYLEQLINNIQ